MIIQPIPSRSVGPRPYAKPPEIDEGGTSGSQPMETMQRVGRGLVGAISGAVIGAGYGLYALRHAPVIAGDFLSAGFHEHRSSPLAPPPGNPVIDGLRDCANATLFATVGMTFTGICLAGQLVALPLLFAVGGAYEGAANGADPCEVTTNLFDGGGRYDGWWNSIHEDFLRERATDKAYDAEHARGHKT